jgi:predicted SAM-dependent methyltransferase
MKKSKRVLESVKKVVMKEEQPLNIDLGCGKNKQAGYVGVDRIAFDGVDIVADLAKDKWPWEDNSVDKAHCSHFVEHLDAVERVHFVNELYRVLKSKAQAQIIVPHWASCRAYGDLTHKWPPVSEFWFYYLSKDWRVGNAPHNDMYECDFEVTWGYGLTPELLSRNEEYKAYAMKNYKEAVTDIIATFAKK